MRYGSRVSMQKRLTLLVTKYTFKTYIMGRSKWNRKSSSTTYSSSWNLFPRSLLYAASPRILTVTTAFYSSLKHFNICYHNDLLFGSLPPTTTTSTAFLGCFNRNFLSLAKAQDDEISSIQTIIGGHGSPLSLDKNGDDYNNDNIDIATYLPSDYPRIDSIKPALSAIRKASRITSYLQPITAVNYSASSTSESISGLVKKDSSPVTIADFAAQALILNILENDFINDIFIAEEGSKDLEEGKLSKDVMEVINTCGFNMYISNVEELKRSIDLGRSYDESDGSISVENKYLKERRWCLDPIDGTRGFLRGKRDGGQYCIALALIEDGVPVVGILGCPNLPTSPTDENYKWMSDETEENNNDTRGCIFVASKGGGCYQLPLYAQLSSSKVSEDDEDQSTKGAVRIHTTSKDSIPLNQARFCIGVEKYGDPLGRIIAIAKKIHGGLDSSTGNDIIYSRRMDSQIKYGVLARGGAEIFARFPKKSYVEFIWDHAAGRVVIEEAGGIQTDTENLLIDYGLGAKMSPMVEGIIASSGAFYHDALLRAYKDVKDQKKE